MGTKRATKQCYTCKQVFRREELVEYASPGAKNLQTYCPKCYEEKLKKDEFASEICKIFGCKKPGPLVNTQRLKKQVEYGYTDQIILDTLHYMYDIKKWKLPDKATLGLVVPANVEEMMKYKRAGNFKKNVLQEAMKTEYNIKYIDVRENEDDGKVELDNIDDYL